MHPPVYEIEDVILAQLRRMAGFVRVDDIDVGLVHFNGIINVGRIAEAIWEERNKVLEQ